MKVLIIGFNEVNVMPYINSYVEKAKELHINYDILEWNRQEEGKLTYNPSSKIWTIKIKVGGESKKKKIVAFFKWRKLVKKFLLKNKYDKIIVLTTLPGILLSSLLIKTYKNKYIFDIRDYTYEKWNLYSRIEKKVLESSYCNVISSKGFLKWLPVRKNIMIAHNISNYVRNFEENIRKDKKITIGYLGCISYLEQNIRLVDSLDENKYNFLYAGVYPDSYNIRDYCKDNCKNNVEFFGKYDNKEKSLIYKKIDLINAIYGNSSALVKYALPNKLYDCIQLKIPILATEGTYLGDVVTKYNIGVAVNLKSNDIQTQIEMYLEEFSKEQFELNCNALLKKVQAEQRKYEEMILNFMKK